MEENQEMEKEWQNLKQWYFEESDKIEAKYPPVPSNQHDAGDGRNQERSQLWRTFINKANSLKAKYGIK